MQIRKQVYELSAADLESFPIWEFALDEEGNEGQDEATVRPFDADFPFDPSDGMFVVKATFQLADGTRLPGYLTPPLEGEPSIDAIQPVIVTKRGQVMPWLGAVAVAPDVLHSAYDKLERTAAAVFPVRYSAVIELVGGPIAGTLNGFMRYQSFSDRRVVEVR